MCPTVLGRIETRTATLIGPALVALILSLATGTVSWLLLIGIFLLEGVILDALFYRYVVKWQPPWLTLVFGIGEFVIVYVLALVSKKVTLSPVDAAWFFWLSWIMAQLTRIVVLPIASLSWIENGGEFRSVGWSILPEREPVAALGTAAVGAADAAPKLARQFSAVNELPAELRDLPSPSGVQRIPEGIAKRA